MPSGNTETLKYHRAIAGASEIQKCRRSTGQRNLRFPRKGQKNSAVQHQSSVDLSNRASKGRWGRPSPPAARDRSHSEGPMEKEPQEMSTQVPGKSGEMKTERDREMETEAQRGMGGRAG